MRFCDECGQVLNLFEDNGTELCPSCTNRKRIAECRLVSKQNPERKSSGFDILSETVLSTENGRIILRSKEGWELWSGPLNTTTELATILSRAKRIYQIRLKRQKN